MTNNGIRKIGIAGAGIMGSSMAQRFKQYHYDVLLFDHSDDAIASSKANNQINQQALIEAGLISTNDSQRILSELNYSTTIASFADCDIVLEAISENIDIKSKFYQQLNQHISTDCLIASNTSALPISQLAQFVDNPARFAGMHWINPPHLIRIIEIIKGEQTANRTIQTIKHLALSIEQIPIVLQKDTKGFAFNRLQFALLREALHLVDNGVATVEDIDQLVKHGLGFRWACCGPFETADFGGIDTFSRISNFLNADLANDSTGSTTLANMTNKAQLGVKSGGGFYDYTDGKATEAIAQRDALLLRLAQLTENNIHLTEEPNDDR